MAEGTGTEGGTTTGTEGAGAPGGGSAGGTSQGGGAGGGASKTFTQDEVDAIVRSRAERMLKQQLGDADLNDLRKKAEEFDKLAESSKTETEKAIEKARKDADAAARAETNKTWESRVLRSEVRLAAGGKLADPEDAIRFIDLSTFKVDDNGNVDEKAIAAAIDDLLKTKPYLAAGNGTRPATTRDFDAGSRTPSAGGRSMNDLIRGAAGH